MGTERFAYLAQLYFMDAIGDVRETRAFMTADVEPGAREDLPS